MSEVVIGMICMAASLVLIQSGMHIGVALMLNHVGIAPWLLYSGLALVAYMFYGWFSTVVGEAYDVWHADSA